MPLHRLILNADDFGRNARVNHAIARSIGQGYCTNTTLMANMPGFAEAVALAGQQRFSDRVGLHLNLYEGQPVTEQIRRCPRICGDDGLFLQEKRPLLFSLSTDERTALEMEIAGQVNRCRSAGLSLSHLDSHCHIHNEWGVARLVMRIARSHGIPHIRLCRHRDPSSVWWKNLYRLLVNFRLKTTGLAGTDFFGTIADALRLHQQIRKPFSMEVMLHPTLDTNDQIVDFFLDGTLAENVGQLLSLANISSWSYQLVASKERV